MHGLGPDRLTAGRRTATPVQRSKLRPGTSNQELGEQATKSGASLRQDRSNRSEAGIASHVAPPLWIVARSTLWQYGWSMLLGPRCSSAAV
eukprot:COSAG02_NODE_4227_length_5610_cov_4.036654_7_plen_91_part_00